MRERVLPVLETELGPGIAEALARTAEQLREDAEAFDEMITSRGTVEGDAEMIGDGVAFAGVAKFPARVKCALMGWKAFQAATSDALGEKE